MSTLEFRIDGTPRLLIIAFFTTLPKLIQHSPFINFGKFCQPLLLFQTPRLFMCTVDSGSVKPRQSHKTVCCTCCFFHIAQNCFLITMKHEVAWRGESSKRTSDSSCRSSSSSSSSSSAYFLCSFCWYFHKIVWWFYFNEISNCCFLPASPFNPTSPFIDFGDFCQPTSLLHPPRLLVWPKFASLPVYSALPFYLKLKSIVFL